jgi:excisionase family DNA binding protein
MAPRILTAQEAADYLRVTRATIRRWCQEGKLPAFRIGREWRINKAELDKITGGNEASASKDDEMTESWGIA